MHFSRVVSGNLNVRHWNRKVWEIGYRGPVLPQQKATGRPDFPVSPDTVNVLRERLAREMNVMKLLTVPYTTKAADQDYLRTKGVSSNEELAKKQFDELEAKRMPGKPKRTEGSKAALRKRGNVGNLLHENQTVEDSLKDLIRRSRWD